MDEQIYAIALSHLKGLSLSAALQLYRHYGSAVAVYEHRAETEGRIRTALADWTEALHRAEAEKAFCEKKDIRILTLNAEDYPARLRECPDAPLSLFYKGTADLNKLHIISVVGTRKISEYGKEICQRFCTDLKRLIPDCLIVSGLAYGVDIHAHRACLSANAETVAVMAHGMDRIYPTMHRNTAAEMIKLGGLLTEYPTGTNPDKGNFVRRNRIVAGLSAATVVIESAAKGGGLITARLAQDYDREVFAFPGRIGDRYSEGCNALIRDNGAALLTSAADLTRALNWETSSEKPEAIQRELFPELDELQRRICQQLQGTEGLSLNKLCIELNEPVQRLSASLLDLEMNGVIKMFGGGKYRLLT